MEAVSGRQKLPMRKGGGEGRGGGRRKEGIIRILWRLRRNQVNLIVTQRNQHPTHPAKVVGYKIYLCKKKNKKIKKIAPKLIFTVQA